MLHNEGKNVELCPGIILWDGITRPDTDPKGTVVHTLKVAIPENAPERQELENLGTQTLQTSEFKGVLPPGAGWVTTQIDMAKMSEDAQRLMGHVAVNAKTRNGAPSIYDANGQLLSAMQYGQMLYPGAIVKLLIHCYPYNQVSKGIAVGLDGVQIIDATAPRLAVGSGGMSADQVGAIFGGGGQPQQPPVPGQPAPPQQPQQVPGQPAPGMPGPGSQAAPQPPVAPHTGFVQNAGKVMTPAAGGYTYEQMIAAGWTDEMLIAQGMMQP